LGASPRAVAKIDGTWANADTNGIDIRDWTTDIDNSIKIYTTNTARHNGKWDLNSYRIEPSNQDNGLEINHSYVWIDGLQVRATTYLYDYKAGIAVIDIFSTGQLEDVKISNNIVKEGNNLNQHSTGIYLNSSVSSPHYIFNNIVYGFSGLDGRGIDSKDDHGVSLIYIYNNTVASSTIGISTDYGDSILKNNLVYDSVDPFFGTFASGSDYNVTDWASSTAGELNTPLHDRINQTFSFVDEDNYDFHLASTDTGAKGYGVNLASDPWIPASAGMTVDIDGSARPSATSSLTWDIGADQTARKIYRSVGPSNTTALADYATEGTLTISSTTATFASALPDKIGVGDVIQYDSDNSGGVDALAFIHGRASSTEYTIRTVAGEYITVASTTITSWEIYRAYTSLYNAEEGTENTGLDDTLENFDTWSGGKDLVASNEQWNIAAYADAVDTTAVTIDGWTTGVQDYIKIFTPVSLTEVGISQRHNGVWGSGYKMEVDIGSIDGVLSVNDKYSFVEGLQIKNVSTGGYYGYGVVLSSEGIKFFNSLVVYNGKGNTDIKGILLGGNINNYYVVNNIVYNFNTCVYENNTTIGGGYLFNNTVNNCSRGFRAKFGGSVVAKNNIVQNSTDGFSLDFDASSDYNISSDSTAPGTNSITNATVKFADALNNDFHLSPIDRTAKNAGTSSVIASVSEAIYDIDGHTRDSDGEGYDIGADEAANAVFYSVGQVSTDHQTSTSTISITNGLATFSVAQTSSVFGVGDRISFGTPTTTVYVSEKVDTSNWYVVTAIGTTPTDVTNELVGSIIHEYTSLANAEAGATDSTQII